MRTASWAAINRMEHPPIMVEQLVTALKTTRPWRDALSLSEHVAKRAIQSKMITATRQEKHLLGLESTRGRDRRSQQRGAAGRRGRSGAEQFDADYSGGAHEEAAHMPFKEAYEQAFMAQKASEQNAKIPTRGGGGGGSGSGDVRNAAKFMWRGEPSASASAGLPQGTELVPIGGGTSAMSSSHPSFSSSDLALSGANSAAPKIARIDVLDCTFGGGHHSRAILEGGDPFTRVVALDCDLDVVTEADALGKAYGPKRFRFFGNHMSNALPMFGEKKFDFIIIDPGPNAMQLFDPSRGFVLDPESDHSLDMRYSKKVGTNALRWLNAENIIQAATDIARVGLLEFKTAHLILMAIKDRKPLIGSRDVLSIVGGGRYGELPEDTWVTQVKDKQLSPAMKFMISLRAVINNEIFELQRAMQDSMLLLKPHGHVAVFTRHAWERNVVRTAMHEHPYGLLAYAEDIPADEVEEYGAPKSTQMHLYRKMDKPAALITNSIKSVTAEDQARSAFVRMTGLDVTTAGGKYGFPSKNFTFHGVNDEVESEALQRNAAGPQADDDWTRGTKEPERRTSKKMPHQ